ncbi:MAG: ParB/RepB/Spo0J family partition protein, partial [Treponema sp.]|nr:ParB/RepB/Spo0J family partition protein [Treponema sp.]
MNVVLLPLDTIGYQSDRTTGGMGDLKTLAESIKKLGLLSPLVVAKQATGSYQLIAGRRRFEAVKLLGWSQVPARIHDSTDEEDLAEISLTENVNRLDMHPLDEAVAFDHLVRKGIPLKDIALRYDRSVSAIYQRLCLMKLLPELKQMFYRGGISLTVAAMLSGLPLEQQEIFYRKHQKYGNIPGYFVHDFIHQVQHCRLGLVLDHKCHACTSRTRHSDRELFPEYEHLEDVCFKESCYRKKLLTQIARKIKEAE